MVKLTAKKVKPLLFMLTELNLRPPSLDYGFLSYFNEINTYLIEQYSHQNGPEGGKN